MTVEKLFQNFVHQVETSDLQMEGIAVADEQRVLFEHHFTPDLPRNIYSHTKSYMSTVAGIAIGEGKLALDDKLTELCPESVPENADPKVHEITLRHLLTMSSGFDQSYLMQKDRRSGVGMPDFLVYMMKQPMKLHPGERFCYSSADSIMAVRMIEKAVGMTMGEYTYRRLFSPLGQGWPIWEHDYLGHANGNGGLFLKLTEMMKLGQLYLADGIWQGNRIVDAGWVKEATTKQIETPGSEDGWRCGYGYQFWMSPYQNGYRCSGSFGQDTVVLPESGLVVSSQCPESGDFQKVLPVFRELLEQL